MYKRQDLNHHQIDVIDLVVVNLYPFRETVAQPDVTWAKAIENIDIGGPAMVRAAAKNHGDVAVLTSPDQYGTVLEALEESGSGVPAELRRRLALEAFQHTAAYDAAISSWMAASVEQADGPYLSAVPLRQTLRSVSYTHLTLPTKRIV